MSSENPVAAAWNRFVNAIVRRRWIALAVSVAITGVTAVSAPMIEVVGDPIDYFPKDDPEVAFWVDMTRRFEGMTVLMVGLEEPGDTMSADGLTTLARVTAKLADLKAEGVLGARSVTNLESIREDSEGTVNAELLVPTPIPTDEAGLKKVAARIMADTQAPGSFVSLDQRGYTIIVRTDTRKDARVVARLVKETVERERGNMKAFYFGAPFVTSTITKTVYAKLPWVAPLFAVLFLGVLLIFLRRPLVLLPIVVASAGLPIVWWLGILGLSGLDVSVAMVNGTLLLLAIGVVAFAGALEAWCRGAPSPLPARFAGGMLALVVAFLGVSVYNRWVPMSLPYLAKLGEVMALGAFVVLAFGLLAFAPLASFVRRIETPAPAPARTGGPAVRGVVLALVAVAIAITAWGTTKLRFNMTQQDMFSRRDDVGAGLSFFDRHYGGNDFVQIHVKGDFGAPETCAQVQRLVDLLEGSGEFADVRAISPILGFLGQNFSGFHRIPNDRESLNNLWFFIEGSSDILQLVSAARDEGMVVCRVPPGPIEESDRQVEAAQRAIAGSYLRGPGSATLRLEALRSRYDLPVAPGTAAQVVKFADTLKTPESIAERRTGIVTRLQEYLGSGESPFTPSPDDMAVLAASLTAASLPPAADLAGTLAALPSFAATQPPEGMAQQLAEQLLQRARDMDLNLAATVLTERYLQGADPAKVPAAAHARIRGVMADLVVGAPDGPDRPVMTVSGFPALVPRVGLQLRNGVLVSTGILAVILALISLLSARFRREGVIAALGILGATVVTLGLGAATGIHVDPGSATLYHLAPVVAWLVLNNRIWGGTRVSRFMPAPVAFSLALGAAGLSLLASGIMPVVRIGAILAIVLAVGALAAAVASRFARPDRA